MKINKMIFVENDGAIQELSKYGFPVHTDYGTREITGSAIQEYRQELLDGVYTYKKEVEHLYNVPTFMETLENALGTDVVKMLLDNELDFVQVVY